MPPKRILMEKLLSDYGAAIEERAIKLSRNRAASSTRRKLDENVSALHNALLEAIELIRLAEVRMAVDEERARHRATRKAS